MTTEPKQLTPTERMKHLSNFVYKGGGYFRDDTIPPKQKAEIIHAPEVLKLALELAAELERVQSAYDDCADKYENITIERDELNRQVEEEKRLRALYYDERNRLQDENTELHKDEAMKGK